MASPRVPTRNAGLAGMIGLHVGAGAGGGAARPTGFYRKDEPLLRRAVSLWVSYLLRLAPPFRRSVSLGSLSTFGFLDHDGALIVIELLLLVGALRLSGFVDGAGALRVARFLCFVGSLQALACSPSRRQRFDELGC